MSHSVRVGIIGMGHAGPAVGSALRASGAEVVGVAARSASAVDRADVMLPGVPILSSAEVASAAEILVLAVPDSEVESLAEELVETGSIRPGMVVVHLSGSLGLGALEPAAAVGAIPMALHPVMTFSGTSLDVRRLQGCPVAYTAPALAQPVALALTEYLGGVGFAVDDESRPLYHAGLTHAANHLVTLVAQAEDVLSAAGIDDPAKTMSPLLRASLDRALNEGISGLTGPVARGDESTVKSHLSALRKRPELRQALTTYEALVAATRAALANQPGTDTTLAAHPTDVDGGVKEPAITVARTREELREALAADSRPTSLVMTMGALHEGHLSLVAQARRPGHKVVATIFVNPQQFGPGEDFDAYPRTFEDDVAALARAGVDILYAPSTEEVYPQEPRVRITPGPSADILEGARRPGHFAGVLQVVGKMLNLIRPQVAVFGQKDAQQYVNIAQMVEDLDIPVELLQAPIVRNERGLALSSRNTYLSEEQREDALALSESLRAGTEVAAAGGDAQEIVNAAAETLAAAPGVETEYVALADASTFRVVALAGASPESVGLDGLASLLPGARAYLLVAARVGPARLIDNVILEVRNSDR